MLLKVPWGGSRTGQGEPADEDGESREGGRSERKGLRPQHTSEKVPTKWTVCPRAKRWQLGSATPSWGRPFGGELTSACPWLPHVQVTETRTEDLKKADNNHPCQRPPQVMEIAAWRE